MKDIYYQLNDLLYQLWRIPRSRTIAMWSVGMFGSLLVIALSDVYEANARFYIDSSSQLRQVVSGTDDETVERLQTTRSEVSRIERVRRVEVDKREELKRQLSKIDPYATPVVIPQQTDAAPLTLVAKVQGVISRLKPALSTGGKLVRIKVPVAGSIFLFVATEVSARRSMDLRTFITGASGDLVDMSVFIMGMESAANLIRGLFK